MVGGVWCGVWGLLRMVWSYVIRKKLSNLLRITYILYSGCSYSKNRFGPAKKKEKEGHELASQNILFGNHKTRNLYGTVENILF